MRILPKSFNPDELLNSVASKYFNNDVNDIFMMRSASGGPKFSNDIWSKLIIDALVAINDGLELDKNASIQKIDKEILINMIGHEAFNTISHIVTTYAAQSIIKEINK